MPPIRLSDSQLDTVMRAVSVLAPADHEAFLRQVAQVLGSQAELGDGLVARACAEIQKRFWRAPEVDWHPGSKHAR